MLGARFSIECAVHRAVDDMYKATTLTTTF